jgi:hypothetical protein
VTYIVKCIGAKADPLYDDGRPYFRYGYDMGTALWTSDQREAQRFLSKKAAVDKLCGVFGPVGWESIMKRYGARIVRLVPKGKK